MAAQFSTLSSAISAALVEQSGRAALTFENISELAELARGVNEEIITFLADQSAIPDERIYVTVQLLRASFDHARALLFLVQTNPRDMGAPSLALHRAQVESFLRALFFGFIADQEQLNDFLENDAGVRTRTEKGKWRNIGVIELAEIVEPRINELADEDIDNPEKLSRMVQNAWDPLCGFVHGGKAIRACYIDTHGQIGCDLPPAVLFQVVCNCFALTNFGFLSALARIYDLPGIQQGSSLSHAMERFIERQRRLVILDR